MMKKILLYLMSIILLTGIVSALSIDYSSDSDNGYLSRNNIYVNLTTDGDFTVINLYNSTGGSLSNNLFTCFQETANIATACGGLSTGTYSSSGIFNTSQPATNGWDGSYVTYAQPNATELATIYMNYTIPTGATRNTLWQLVTKSNYGAGISVNVTIPTTCWNNNPTLQLSVEMYNDLAIHYVYPQCYNGTAWNIITISQTSNHSGIYEEALYWQIANGTSKNFTGLNNGTYYVNATTTNSTNGVTANTATRNITILTSFTNNSYTVVFPYPNNFYLNRSSFTVNFTSTDPFYAYAIYNITGITNTSYTTVVNTTAKTYTFTSLPNGLYYYSLKIYDLSGNMNYYDPNITIDTVYPSINYSADTDISGSIFNTRQDIYVNLSVNDTNLNYTIIRLYNSTGLQSTALATVNDFMNLTNGIYYFNATAYDLAGNSNSTATRNITINYYKNNVTFYAYQRTTNATIPYDILFEGASNTFIVNNNGSDKTTIPIDIPWDIYNVTINGSGTYNCTYLNWNATSNYVFPDCILYDNILTITEYASYLGTAITSFDVTLTLGTYTETQTASPSSISFNLIQGQNYTLQYYHPLFINKTRAYIPNALSTTINESIDQTQITLFFKHAFTGVLANGSTITINDTSVPGKSFSTTNGTIYFTPNSGAKNFTMTATGDAISQPFNIVTSNGEIGTRDILLYPILALTILDEKRSLTQLVAPFDFTSPDELKYTLYCYEPITYTISLIIPNSTTGVYYIPAPCVFNRLKFDLSWNNIGGIPFSYYRTLTFPRTTQIFALDVYLLDAFTTDGVESYLKPYDIFGTYIPARNAAVQVFEIFPTGTHLVTSDYIDAEAKMSVRLMKGAQYILTLTADGAPLRTVGPYYADQSGTKGITVFDITLTGPTEDQQQIVHQTIVDKVNNTVSQVVVDYTKSITLLRMELYGASCDTPGVLATTPLIAATYDNISLVAADYRAAMTYNVVNSSPYWNSTNQVSFCALYNITNQYNETEQVIETATYSTSMRMPSTFRNRWTFPWIFMILLVIMALGANARTAGPLSLVMALMASLLYAWQWIGTNSPPGVLPHVAIGLTVLIAILLNFKRVS